MSQSLIQIDGKFYEKCKVVMLPTENASNIVKRIVPDESIIYYKNSVDNTETFHNPQHLYILSDEEIKEGDYVIDIYIDVLLGKMEKSDFPTFNKDLKKVISSTDKSLNLPELSVEFIKKYCKLSGIDEVLVEYVKKHTKLIDNEFFIKDESYELKVVLDNTIVIKELIEKLYTKIEVIDLMRKTWDVAMQESNSTEPSSEFKEIEFDEWIEQNL